MSPAELARSGRRLGRLLGRLLAEGEEIRIRAPGETVLIEVVKDGQAVEIAGSEPWALSSSGKVRYVKP